MSATKLTVTLMALACALSTAESLKICAFNVRALGDTKVSNATIANILVNIITMYDIAVIQEVRDADLSAVHHLMNLIDRKPDSYSYVISEPLGRSSYKEQYLFIYRNGQVSVIDSYQYDDGCESCGTDTFSREPFIVKFFSPFSDVREFVIVPQHTSPDEAVEEIDGLYDVFLDVQSKWRNDNILFMGDFNADCDYVRPDEWHKIRLRTDTQFLWLISNSSDTTVSTTHCAYDRIVASGEAMKNALVPGSAVVYNYQAAFNLKYDDAYAVSDHFPVEVTLL
ncbi:deoxyribonuclease-1 [Latimeria chalumnae]|uniref:Deoxyribonuclease n=1 Tax=Latimeria chalumnae TaxID=7897 RepID=H3B348_LATCH|nr:PREDICTED: deoxyribonuclease-1-like 2 [Latimeria chalumnae]|eukprot:XP_006001522.1 PREDICTED: deoxyribonuclease-1-like 2 [Latimeria chalumnae]